ncbi:proline-rich protein 19 [Nothobranchius furzeri]|uniref:LOC107379525-like protein n=2 Tax=Nothobranchius furzeri TaxID=105023 RepID=A0A1A8B538_NOTFU|nr:uncharacterized protein si:dkey-250k15.4 [Nothobranchius furzeri]KAF7227053.1 putative LOC107379525-like protein [Nothobranchius furzeri]
MSHVCGKASSEKTFCIFSKQPKPTDKRCCSVTTLVAPAKYFNHCKNANEQLKVKRLKTRKERSQMRGDWKETSRTKSHHHCHCKSWKENAFLQNFCHNGVHQTSRRSTTISSVVPAAQEPSVITESRLTGPHRLFNHEVKSIDIERLLSERSKHEKKEEQVTEESNNSSASHIPVLLSGDAVAAREKAESEANTRDNPQETEDRNPQQSDITPGQRLQQQAVSSGSCKSISSSKLCPASAETKTKRRKTCVSPPADGEHVKTSNNSVTRRVLSDVEEPREKKSHQNQADGLKSSPPLPSSSPTSGSADTKPKEHDPKYVDKLVTAVAARLCGSLCLFRDERHDLLSKRRSELQKALLSRHGPRLQANLLEIQKCDTNPSQTALDPVMKQDERLPTEERTGSGPFSWDASPQLHMQQTAEESNPEDTSLNFLDKIIRPCSSHPFNLNCEPSWTTANDVFVSSSNLFQEDKSFWKSWEEFGPEEEQSAPFESFSSSFMTQDATDISCRQQQHRTNNQPFFLQQDRHPEDLIQSPQEEDPFEPRQFSFPHSFSNQIQHHPQPFDRLSTHPASYMMRYPPSHMLELSPAPAPSVLPSPEHWSFPPMRLY